MKTETNESYNESNHDQDKIYLKEWEEHLQKQEDYQFYRFAEFERKEEELNEQEERLNKRERENIMWKTRANETSDQLDQKETDCVRLKLELDEKYSSLRKQRELIAEYEKVTSERLFEVESDTVDAKLKAL